MATKTFTYVGVKSGYLAFSVPGLRGTVYMPKGFFAANAVPASFTVNAEFAQPVAAPATVSALQAEIAALKAQLENAANAVPEIAPAAPAAPAEISAPAAEIPANIVPETPAPVASKRRAS